MYESPQSISTHKLTYPPKELRLGREGWVVVSYVVNTDGSVSDAIVIDSDGGKGFEKHGLKYIRKARFIPAKLNGATVKSSNAKHKLNWELAAGRRGVSKKFLSRYRTLRKYLEENELAEYESRIDDFNEKLVKNYEERAWFSLLQSNYYRINGDKKNYLAYLNRTLGYESPALPKTMYTSALSSLYTEQVSQGKYVEAFETAQRISNKYSKHPDIKSVLKHKDYVIASLAQIEVIITQGRIENEEQPWHHNLYRKHISVKVEEGKLDKLELRCERKTTTLDISDLSVLWKIPKSWGNCTAQFWGKAGTQLKLLEQIEQKVNT